MSVRFSIKLKLVSILTALSMVVTSVSWADPAKTLIPLESKISKQSFSLAHLSIPGQLGNIEVQFQSQTTKPLVIYIQDAHAVIDAQENIRGLIELFQKQFGISTVAFEGASGRLDPTLLRAFPDNLLKKKGLLPYLERGELNAVEMAAVLNPDEAKYVGLENPELYQKNYDAYLAARENQKKAQRYLLKLRRLFDSNRKEVYSQSLNRFHDYLQDFESEKTDLGVFLSLLYKEFGKTLDNFSESRNLDALASFLKEAEPSAKAQMDIELNRLAVDWIKLNRNKLSAAQIRLWNQNYQSFRSDQVDSFEFLRRIEKIAGQVKSPFNYSGTVRHLMVTAEKLSQIKGTRLARELDALIKEIWTRLVKTEEQKRLLDLYSELKIFEDLNRLELSPEYWETFKQNQKKLLDRMPEAKQYLKPALDFYHYAELRDQSFHENLENMIQKEKLKAVLVLAGGFHSKGFENYLKRSGSSYLIISPRISGLSGHENYDTVMSAGLSYKQASIKSFYDAFARHSSRNLVKNMDEYEMRRTLKTWRDNVIKALSREGRIDDAWQYTRYIDLLYKDYIEKYIKIPDSLDFRSRLLEKIENRFNKFLLQTHSLVAPRVALIRDQGFGFYGAQRRERPELRKKITARDKIRAIQTVYRALEAKYPRVYTTMPKGTKGTFLPAIFSDLFGIFNRRLRPGMKTYELGSGDGRVAFVMALFGAKVKAIEFEEQLDAIAREAYRDLIQQGVFDGTEIEFIRGDFLKQNLSDADFVFFQEASTYYDADDDLYEKLLEIQKNKKLILYWAMGVSANRGLDGFEAVEIVRNKNKTPVAKIFQRSELRQAPETDADIKLGMDLLAPHDSEAHLMKALRDQSWTSGGLEKAILEQQPDLIAFLHELFVSKGIAVTDQNFTELITAARVLYIRELIAFDQETTSIVSGRLPKPESFARVYSRLRELGKSDQEIFEFVKQAILNRKSVIMEMSSSRRVAISAVMDDAVAALVRQSSRGELRAEHKPWFREIAYLTLGAAAYVLFSILVYHPATREWIQKFPVLLLPAIQGLGAISTVTAYFFAKRFHAHILSAQKEEKARLAGWLKFNFTLSSPIFGFLLFGAVFSSYLDPSLSKWEIILRSVGFGILNQGFLSPLLSDPLLFMQAQEKVEGLSRPAAVQKAREKVLDLVTLAFPIWVPAIALGFYFSVSKPIVTIAITSTVGIFWSTFFTLYNFMHGGSSWVREHLSYQTPDGRKELYAPWRWIQHFYDSPWFGVYLYSIRWLLYTFTAFMIAALSGVNDLVLILTGSALGWFVWAYKFSSQWIVPKADQHERSELRQNLFDPTVSDEEVLRKISAMRFENVANGSEAIVLRNEENGIALKIISSRYDVKRNKHGIQPVRPFQRIPIVPNNWFGRMIRRWVVAVFARLGIRWTKINIPANEGYWVWRDYLRVRPGLEDPYPSRVLGRHSILLLNIPLSIKLAVLSGDLIIQKLVSGDEFFSQKMREFLAQGDIAKAKQLIEKTVATMTSYWEGENGFLNLDINFFENVVVTGKGNEIGEVVNIDRGGLTIAPERIRHRFLEIQEMVGTLERALMESGTKSVKQVVEAAVEMDGRLNYVAAMLRRIYDKYSEIDERLVDEVVLSYFDQLRERYQYEKWQAARRSELRSGEPEVENPFPDWRIQWPAYFGQDFFYDLSSKDTMRNLSQGGALTQPRFFSFRGIRGEPDADQVDRKNRISGFAEVREKILSGEFAFPFIFKPNYSALGKGIFYVEEEGESLKVTLTYTPLQSVSSITAQELEVLVRDVRINEEENTMHFYLPKNDDETWALLQSLAERLAGAGDEGMVEEKLPVISFEGKAYDTRLYFKGNIGTGKFQRVKNKDYAHIGSSGYFANYGGRAKAYKRFKEDSFGPLLALYPDLKSRQREFFQYVDRILEKQLVYLSDRLKAGGLELNIQVDGHFDLMWLAPENPGDFPRPALIESTIYERSGAFISSLQYNLARYRKIHSRSELRKRDEFWKNKQVAITGAAGHIGSVLTDRTLALARDVTMILLGAEYREFVYHQFDHKNKADVQVSRLPHEDIQKKMALQNDVIFHLADPVTSGDPASHVSLAEMISVDALPLALMLVEAEKKKNPPRVIYASSIEVYGLIKPEERAEKFKPEYKLKEEDLVIDPKRTTLAPVLSRWIVRAVDELVQFPSFVSNRDAIDQVEKILQKFPPPEEYAAMPHALSKALGEEVLRRYSNGVAVRLGGVYGPGYDAPNRFFKHRLPHKFLELARENQDIRYTEARKGFLYVEDAVDALIRAAEIPAVVFEDRDRVVNLGSRELSSAEEIAETVRRMTKSSSELVLDTETPDQSNILLDLTRLESVLGVNPLNWQSLDDGVEKTWKWIQEGTRSENTWANRFFSKVRKHPKPTLRELTEFRNQIKKNARAIAESQRRIQQIEDSRKERTAHISYYFWPALVLSAIPYLIKPAEWTGAIFWVTAAGFLFYFIHLMGLDRNQYRQSDDDAESLKNENRELRNRIFSWLSLTKLEDEGRVMSSGDIDNYEQIEKAFSQAAHAIQFDLEEYEKGAPERTLAQITRVVSEFKHSMYEYRTSIGNDGVMPIDQVGALFGQVEHAVDEFLFDCAEFLAGEGKNKELLEHLMSTGWRNIERPMNEFSRNWRRNELRKSETLGKVLREMAEKVDFDFYNQRLRHKDLGGDYEENPFPAAGSMRNEDSIRSDWRFKRSVFGFLPMSFDKQKAFEFLMFGAALEIKDLERIFGNAFGGQIEELIKNGIMERIREGKIRLKDLSLASRKLPNGKVIYFFADTPYFFEKGKEYTRVYIGSDSYKLLDRVSKLKGVKGYVAEMGSGSGVQLLAAVKQFPGIQKAIGVEIDERARKISALNAEMNGESHRIEFVENEADLKRALGENRISLAISNPPFIAMPEEVQIVDSTRRRKPQQLSLKEIWGNPGWGGPDGITVTREFVNRLMPLLGENAQLLIYSQFAGNDEGPTKISEFLDAQKQFAYLFEALEPVSGIGEANGELMSLLHHYKVSSEWFLAQLKGGFERILFHLGEFERDAALDSIIDQIRKSYESQEITHFHSGFIVAAYKAGGAQRSELRRDELARQISLAIAPLSPEERIQQVLRITTAHSPRKTAMAIARLNQDAFNAVVDSRKYDPDILDSVLDALQPEDVVTTREIADKAWDWTVPQTGGREVWTSISDRLPHSVTQEIIQASRQRVPVFGRMSVAQVLENQKNFGRLDMPVRLDASGIYVVGDHDFAYPVIHLAKQNRTIAKNGLVMLHWDQALHSDGATQKEVMDFIPDASEKKAFEGMVAAESPYSAWEIRNRWLWPGGFIEALVWDQSVDTVIHIIPSHLVSTSEIPIPSTERFRIGLRNITIYHVAPNQVLDILRKMKIDSSRLIESVDSDSFLADYAGGKNDNQISLAGLEEFERVQAQMEQEQFKPRLKLVALSSPDYVSGKLLPELFPEVVDRLSLNRSELREQNLWGSGKAAAHGEKLEGQTIEAEKLNAAIENIRIRVEAISAQDPARAEAQKVYGQLKKLSESQAGIQGIDEQRWTDGGFYFGKSTANKITIGQGVFVDPLFAAQMLFKAGEESIGRGHSDELFGKVFGSEAAQFAGTYQQFRDLSRKDFVVSSADRFEEFMPGHEYFDTEDLFSAWIKSELNKQPLPEVEQAGFLIKRLVEVFGSAQSLSPEETMTYFQVAYPFFMFCIYRNEILRKLALDFEDFYQKTDKTIPDTHPGKKGLDPDTARENIRKALYPKFNSTIRIPSDSVLLSGVFDDISFEAFAAARNQKAEHVSMVLSGAYPWFDALTNFYGEETVYVDGLGKMSRANILELLRDFEGVMVRSEATGSKFLVTQSLVPESDASSLSQVVSSSSPFPSARVIVVDKTPIHGFLGARVAPVHQQIDDEKAVSVIRRSILWASLFYVYSGTDFEEAPIFHSSYIRHLVGSLIILRSHLTPESENIEESADEQLRDLMRAQPIIKRNLKKWLDELIPFLIHQESIFWNRVPSVWNSQREFNQAVENTQERQLFWYYTIMAEPDGLFARLSDGLELAEGSDFLTHQSARNLVDTMLAILYTGLPREPQDNFYDYFLHALLQHIEVYPDGIRVKDLPAFKNFLRRYVDPDLQKPETNYKERFQAFIPRFVQDNPNFDDTDLLVGTEDVSIDPSPDSSVAHIRHSGRQAGYQYFCPMEIPIASALNWPDIPRRIHDLRLYLSRVAVWTARYSAQGVAIAGTNMKLVIPGLADGTLIRFENDGAFIVVRKVVPDVNFMAHRIYLRNVDTQTEFKFYGKDDGKEIPHEELKRPPLAELESLTVARNVGHISKDKSQPWQIVPDLEKIKPVELEGFPRVAENGFYQADYSGGDILWLSFGGSSEQAIQVPALAGKAKVLIQRHDTRIVLYQSDGTYIDELQIGPTGKVTSEFGNARKLPPLKPSVEHLRPSNSQDYENLNRLALKLESEISLGRGYEKIDMDLPGEAAVIEVDANQARIRISKPVLSAIDQAPAVFTKALKTGDPVFMLEEHVKKIRAVWTPEKLSEASAQIEALPETVSTLSETDQKSWSDKGSKQFKALLAERKLLVRKIELARAIDQYRQNPKNGVDIQGSATTFRKGLIEVLDHAFSGSTPGFFFVSNRANFRYAGDVIASDREKPLEGVGLARWRNLKFSFDVPDKAESDAHFELRQFEEENADNSPLLFIRFGKRIKAGEKVNNIGVVQLFDLKTGQALKAAKQELVQRQRAVEAARRNLLQAISEQNPNLSSAELGKMIQGLLAGIQAERSELRSATDEISAKLFKSLEIRKDVLQILAGFLPQAIKGEEYSENLKLTVLKFIFRDILFEGAEKAKDRAEKLRSKLSKEPGKLLFAFSYHLEAHGINPLQLEEDFVASILISNLEISLKENLDWTNEDYLEGVLTEAEKVQAHIEAALDQNPDMASSDGLRWTLLDKAVGAGLATRNGTDVPTPVQGYFIRKYFKQKDAEARARREAEETARQLELGKVRVVGAEEAKQWGHIITDFGNPSGSALLFQTNQTNLLVDAGIALRANQINPYAAMEKPHAIVITHGHLDHVQSLLEASDAAGENVPVFMTAATRMWVKSMLKREIAYQTHSESERYSRNQKLDRFFNQRVVTLQFGLPVRVSQDVVIELIPAGHFPGAASVMITTPFGKTLLTSDISFHGLGPVDGFKPETSFQDAHTILMDTSLAGLDLGESTHEEREKVFIDQVRQAMQNPDAKVLISLGPGMAPHLFGKLAEALHEPVRFVFYGGTAIRERQLFQSFFPEYFTGIKSSFPQHKTRDVSSIGNPLESEPGHGRVIYFTTRLDVEYVKSALRVLGSNPDNFLFVDYFAPDAAKNKVWGNSAFLSPENGAQRIYFKNQDQKDDAGALIYPIQLFSHPLRGELISFLQRMNPKRVILLHSSGDTKQGLLGELHRNFSQFNATTSTGLHIGDSPFIRQQPNGQRILDQEALAAYQAGFQHLLTSAVDWQGLVERNELRFSENDPNLEIVTLDKIVDSDKRESFYRLVMNMLRTSTESDLETIDYQIEGLRKLSAEGQTNYVVAFRGKEAIGYRVFTANPSNQKMVNGLTIYIAPYYRNSGVARKIHQTTLELLAQRGIDVYAVSVDYSDAARKFHEAIIRRQEKDVFDVKRQEHTGYLLSYKIRILKDSRSELRVTGESLKALTTAREIIERIFDESDEADKPFLGLDQRLRAELRFAVIELLIPELVDGVENSPTAEQFLYSPVSFDHRLLNPKNRQLLEQGLKLRFGAETNLKDFLALALDGKFIAGDESESARSVIEHYLASGAMIVPFEKGTESKIPLLKIPGIRTFGYDHHRKFEVGVSDHPYTLYLVPVGMPIEAPKSTERHTGLFVSEKLYFESKLSPQEFVVLSEMILSVESLRKQLADYPGQIFPQLNSQVLQASLQVLAEISRLSAVREALSASA